MKIIGHIGRRYFVTHKLSINSIDLPNIDRHDTNTYTHHVNTCVCVTHIEN